MGWMADPTCIVGGVVICTAIETGRDKGVYPKLKLKRGDMVRSPLYGMLSGGAGAEFLQF